MDISTGGVDIDGQTDLDELVVAGVSTFSAKAVFNTAYPSIDADNEIQVGTAIQLGKAGVITATSFSGDGSGLTGIAATDHVSTFDLVVAGIATFYNDVKIVGGGSTAGNQITIGATTLNDGTLTFDGTAGQLFSISNNLTDGSIFSVNDVSGMPSIDVGAAGTIQLAPYGTGELVGIGTTRPTSKLDVVGDVQVVGVVTATSFSGSGASLTGLTGASAATYGDASNVAQIVVNTDGKITGISNVSISGGGGGGGGASGVWETNTTGINTSTNVGIGTTTASDATLVVDVGTASTALVIKGSEGQLFSVTNNLTSGSIFAVNDISGVPSINVDASGDVQLGPFNATDRVAIGQTSSGTKLGVKGSISERVYVVNDELSDIASDRINIDDGNVQYYSVAEDGGTLTPDITSTNGLNNDLAIGDSVTVVVIIKPDSTSDKITNITIDGSAATEEWLGGSAPDGGASGSYDVYTFFILKTADATFLPLCNKVNYA